MLQAAFSAIFSAPQGVTRKVWFLPLQRGATPRSGKIAKTLWDMANFARRGVASDLEYLKIHLRPHFLRRTKLARIAAEDTFEMGSITYQI